MRPSTIAILSGVVITLALVSGEAQGNQLSTSKKKPVAGSSEAFLCLDCHKKETPGVVSDWQLSKHSKNGVDCAVCHGDEHRSAEDVSKVQIPTPETCAACH